MASTALAGLASKIESGERLSDEEVQALDREQDIIALGMLADNARRKLHGARVTYVKVLDFPATQGAASENPGELRVGLTPATLVDAEAAVEQARDAGVGAPLSGFSLADLEGLADPLPVTLKALKQAGLELVAFAPIDKLKHVERSLEAVIDAGLVVARLTIDESPNRPWSDVCRQVAALQRKLQAFRVFAPLPRRLNLTQPTTGYEDVKRVAVSRLLAEGVDTIQIDWALYGPKLAQVALTFGADDLDSVSATDDQSKGHRRAPAEEVQRSIKSAGFEPAARNARFELT